MTSKALNTRLCLYIAIAMVGSLISDLKVLSPEIVLYWWDWLLIILEAIFVSLVTWRAFIDQSPAKLEPPES